MFNTRQIYLMGNNRSEADKRIVFLHDLLG